MAQALLIGLFLTPGRLLTIKVQTMADLSDKDFAQAIDHLNAIGWVEMDPEKPTVLKFAPAYETALRMLLQAQYDAWEAEEAEAAQKKKEARKPLVSIKVTIDPSLPEPIYDHALGKDHLLNQLAEHQASLPLKPSWGETLQALAEHFNVTAGLRMLWVEQLADNLLKEMKTRPRTKIIEPRVRIWEAAVADELRSREDLPVQLQINLTTSAPNTPSLLEKTLQALMLNETKTLSETQLAHLMVASLAGDTLDEAQVVALELERIREWYVGVVGEYQQQKGLQTDSKATLQTIALDQLSRLFSF